MFEAYQYSLGSTTMGAGSAAAARKLKQRLAQIVHVPIQPMVPQLPPHPESWPALAPRDWAAAPRGSRPTPGVHEPWTVTVQTAQERARNEELAAFQPRIEDMKSKQ